MGKRRLRFGTWCRKDEDDERKINYTFTDSNGEVLYFTSEDIVSWNMLSRIRNAWITSIKLIKNEFNNPEGEWYAVLYED